MEDNWNELKSDARWADLLKPLTRRELDSLYRRLNGWHYRALVAHGYKSTDLAAGLPVENDLAEEIGQCSVGVTRELSRRIAPQFELAPWG